MKLPRWVWLLLGGALLCWAVATFNPFEFLFGKLLPDEARDREIAALIERNRTQRARVQILLQQHIEDSLASAALRAREADAVRAAGEALSTADSLEGVILRAEAAKDTSALVVGLKAQNAQLRLGIAGLAEGLTLAQDRASLWETRAYSWMREVRDSLQPLNDRLAKELAREHAAKKRWKLIALVSNGLWALKSGSDLVRQK